MKLKIGDKLFKYAGLSGVLEYTVYEVRESKDNIMYAIECNSCSHGFHEKCKVLITQHEAPSKRELGNYKFVAMLGEEEDNDNHYFFHHMEYFRLTRKDALIDKADKYLGEAYVKLQKTKELYEILQKNYDDFSKYRDELRKEFPEIGDKII